MHWLCLLAKRSVKQANDTRPIALTDSLGKVILGLLTHSIRPQVLPVFAALPIFAFIPGRGTDEAIMCVFEHCRHVRSQCEAQGGTFWSRLAGHRPKSLTGGALLSLDMSQAFDRLPRNILHEGFQLTMVPPAIAHLFLHWLQGAQYHLTHRGVSCSITSTRGVRQGCKASPLEWTIFLCAALKRLDATMPHATETSWIKSHLITNADDIISKWVIHQKSDVDIMLMQIGTLLDVLQDVGMQVNLSKTAFLIRLSGHQARSIRKNLIIKRDSQQWIRIPRNADEDTFIPVKQSHQYLGVIASFYAFEDLTLSYRLRVGRVTFLRLRPWLVKRHTYPLTLRLNLWQTCVKSSYVYGLQAVGLTPRGALRLHQQSVADIRSIARSPSHVTFESTLTLFNRLGMDLPLVGLQTLWTQQ